MDGEANHERRARALSEAGLAFALVAPLTYGAQRLLERLRSPHLSPGLVLLSSHQAYGWRSLVATWFAGAAAGVVYVTARERAAAGQRAKLGAIATVVMGLLFVGLALAFP